MQRIALYTSTYLYCIVLHCTVQHCTAVHCTALYCSALIVTYCSRVQCGGMPDAVQWDPQRIISRSDIINLHCTVQCIAMYTSVRCTAQFSALQCLVHCTLHCTVVPSAMMQGTSGPYWRPPLLQKTVLRLRFFKITTLHCENMHLYHLKPNPSIPRKIYCIVGCILHLMFSFDA